MALFCFERLVIMEEKIERNELISFLKKISENTLTKEIEVEVPLGLSHGVYAGIRPQTVKVDVKWLFGQVINELESPVKSIGTEKEKPKFARCIKTFIHSPFLIYAGKVFEVLCDFPGNEELDIESEILLEDVDTGIDFSLPLLLYDAYFELVN